MTWKKGKSSMQIETPAHGDSKCRHTGHMDYCQHQSRLQMTSEMTLEVIRKKDTYIAIASWKHSGSWESAIQS
jgi:hypothetical protein